VCAHQPARFCDHPPTPQPKTAQPPAPTPPPPQGSTVEGPCQARHFVVAFHGDTAR